MSLSLGWTLLAAPGDLDPRFDAGAPPRGYNSGTVPMVDGTVYSCGEIFVNGRRDFTYTTTNFNYIWVGRFRGGILQMNFKDQRISYCADVHQSEPTWSVWAPPAKWPLVVSPKEDRIYLNRSFSFANGTLRTDWLALTPEGQIVPGFNPVLQIGTGDASNPDRRPNIFHFAVEPDGSIVFGGDFRFVNGLNRDCVARIDPTGTVDANFNPGSRFRGKNQNLWVDTILLQPDGKLLIHGSYTNTYPVIRVLPNGAMDSSFHPPPAILGGDGFPTAEALKLWPDGKIQVATNVRLLTDGSIDTTYVGHFFPNSGVKRVEIAPDLSFYADIDSGSLDVPTRVHLYNDGTVDPDFARKGRIGSCTQILALPDGRAFVASDRGAVRLNTDGSLDRTFPTSDITDVRAIAAGGGKLYISGGFNYSGFQVRRYESNGVSSLTLTTSGGFVSSMLPLADGGLLLAGHFTGVNGVSVTNLARTLANGSVDKSFTDKANIGQYSTLNALAALRSGQLYIAGDSIKRLNPDGSLDPGFKVANTFTSSSQYGGKANCIFPLPDNSLLVGGFFDHFEGIGNGGFIHLKADGSLDRSFLSTQNFQSVTSIATQSDGKIVIAALYGVFRLNADGSPDLTFKIPVLPRPNWLPYPFPTPPPTSVVLSVDRWDDILIAGQFTSVNGINIDNVARLQGGALERSPVRFDSPKMTSASIQITATGPTNYEGVLEANRAGAWTPLYTNIYTQGQVTFNVPASRDVEILRLRVSRP